MSAYMGRSNVGGAEGHKLPGAFLQINMLNVKPKGQHLCPPLKSKAPLNPLPRTSTPLEKSYFMSLCNHLSHNKDYW